MQNTDRRIYAVANRLYDSLLRKRVRILDRIHGHLEDLRRFQELINMQMKEIGYLTRPGCCLSTEPSILDRFQQLTREIRNKFDRIQNEPPATWPAPLLHDLFDELHALENEFGGWNYHDQEITVTIEPIVFKEVHLGSFAIRLSLRDLAQFSYEIEALEPNCPPHRSDVPHPHVADGVLCEGEAGAAISSALGQGRICDFFILVRSVLTTYNPRSPHVPIEKWEGQTCDECGSFVSDDDAYGCNACNSTCCCDCNSSCEQCEDSFCNSCLNECRHCRKTICKRCIETCEECEAPQCSDCLIKCPTCEKKVCDDCTAPCKECGEVFCLSCLEDSLCVGCHQPATVPQE